MISFITFLGEWIPCVIEFFDFLDEGIFIITFSLYYTLNAIKYDKNC